MRKRELAIAVGAALSLPGCTLTTPPVTEVIQVAAVDAQGQPSNHYDERPFGGTTIAVFGCAASPAAVSADIYQCWPSAAGADVCWPAAPDSLLCLDDPWDKRLHRLTVADALPQVQPTANPQPFALLLDDGTRCRRRNGGAWGGRDDGYIGVYGCQSSPLTVLVQPGQNAIDRTVSQWTVHVGELGAGNPHFPPPQTRAIRAAWFAGHSG